MTRSNRHGPAVLAAAQGHVRLMRRDDRLEVLTDWTAAGLERLRAERGRARLYAWAVWGAVGLGVTALVQTCTHGT